MTIRRPRLILAAALLLAACGKEEKPGGVIPPEKFVAANVAVRSLPDGATAAERAAVLRKHGVTEVQLKAWVNGHARDPETLAKAWEQIAFRLDSLSHPTVYVPPQPSPTAPGAQVPPPRPAEMADSVITRRPPPPPPDWMGDPRAGGTPAARKPRVQ